MSSKQVNAFVGQRKSGFNAVHAAGIVGAVAGALSNYAEGSSLISAAAGGAIGAAAGYAFADILGGGESESLAIKVLGGTTSAMFGMAIGGLGTGLIDSISKIGGDRSPE